MRPFYDRFTYVDSAAITVKYVDIMTFCVHTVQILNSFTANTVKTTIYFALRTAPCRFSR